MDTLRLALISTPRSGNTWLRHMLAQALELSEQAVHLPEEVNWQALPPRVILQLHWPPDEDFVSQLDQHGFRPIVLARHPLDVLISILSFSQHDDSTLRWLGGAGGNERCIDGASPLSEAFLAYATGPRASALLGVSADWWQTSNVYRLRYEDLVLDTVAELSGILTSLDVAPRRSLADVSKESTTDHLRTLSVDLLYHVWQAQPGIWKRLLTPPAAHRIREVHQKILNTFGYLVEPDDLPTAPEAQQSWERFEAAALKRSVIGLKQILAKAEANHQRDLSAQQRELANLLQQLQHMCDRHEASIAKLESRYRSGLAEQRAALDGLAREFKDLPWQQIRELSSLGPWSLGTAAFVHRWSRRLPRASSGFKSLVIFWQSILGQRHR